MTNTPSDDRAALRRTPRQQRSRATVERLLDTTEAVLAEVGYDALTTNLVASRAGASIGSLYGFFPGKEALVHALAERYVSRLSTLYATEIVDRDIPTEEMVHRIIGVLDEFYRAHPAVGSILAGPTAPADLRAAGAQLRAAFVRQLERLLEHRRPDLAAERRHLITEVVVELVQALLGRAASAGAAEHAALVGELELAIMSYVRAAAPRLP